MKKRWETAANWKEGKTRKEQQKGGRVAGDRQVAAEDLKWLGSNPVSTALCRPCIFSDRTVKMTEMMFFLFVCFSFPGPFLVTLPGQIRKLIFKIWVACLCFIGIKFLPVYICGQLVVTKGQENLIKKRLIFFKWQCQKNCISTCRRIELGPNSYHVQY